MGNRPKLQRSTIAATGTLAWAQSGVAYRIVEIHGTALRQNLMRVGLSEGATVQCIINIRQGPLVLRYGRTDLAVGRRVAQSILGMPVALARRAQARK